MDYSNFFLQLWAPSARPIKSSYASVACPLISRSLFLKEVVSLWIWTQATMKLSRVKRRVRASYLASRFVTKVGLNLYPICWNAKIGKKIRMSAILHITYKYYWWYNRNIVILPEFNSVCSIWPDLSLSKLSKTCFHLLISWKSRWNSKMLMVPVLSPSCKSAKNKKQTWS